MMGRLRIAVAESSG